MRHTRSRFH